MPPSYIYIYYFLDKREGKYWQKTLLDDLLGGPQYEKIKNTEGKHPEISIIFDCNRFFLN